MAITSQPDGKPYHCLLGCSQNHKSLWCPRLYWVLLSGVVKSGSTPIDDGSSFQELLQSRRDHLWFCFKKGDQKATAGKSTYGDSTTDKAVTAALPPSVGITDEEKPGRSKRCQC